MITKPRFTMMTVAILMVFVLSAMWTVPAFADDSTPPPVETPTEVTPPVEEETAETPPAEPEVASADSVVVVDESTPEVTDAPAEPVALTEVLEQLPEGTEVQVVDENGEALPLVSQEAADAVELGDPIWCPVGVVPKPSLGGCSPRFTSFTNDATPTDDGLIDWLNDVAHAGAVSKAGVISVAGSYTGSTEIGGEIVIDGMAVAGTMENFALTIKGGWSGAANTVTSPSDPSEFIGVSLSIIHWNGNIIISDILIDGATSNTDTGDNTYALEVETYKNIQLDRVTVKNSLNTSPTGTDAMTGAKLYNALSTVSSTVIVNNGVFQDNEGDGLLIQSAGVVTITSLFADGNDASGAVIDNTFNPSLTAPDKAVTLKGSQEFNNNGDAGLTVNSKGLITISNVVATENAANGVNLNNTTSLTKQGVTVSGTNYFASNAFGIEILTRGAITANNINATDNGGTGAYMDNCDITLPTGFCLTITAKTVKLTGFNYFNNNGNNGLEIYSFGAITASNLMSSGNNDTGVILDNQTKNTAPVAVDSVGTITLTGYGIFTNNGIGDGLKVKSHGNITLTNLTANNNGNGVDDVLGDSDISDNGVEVNAQRTNVGTKVYIANVTISGLNYFIENNEYGLHIDADGKITVSSITANFNAGNGAELNTTDIGYGVTLTGTNTFMENGATGLLVDSTGAVTVSNVASVYNLTGASFNNQFDPAKRYNVTLSGINSFNWNDESGLLVDSYGVITVNNLTANWNGMATGSGAILDNCNLSAGLCTATTASAVTLTGYMNTIFNIDKGLEIDSLGAVTLSNAVANGNGNVGVHIQNKFNPLYNKAIVRGVTLKGTNIFNSNLSTGLFIQSYGAITLNNVSADYNGDSTSGSGSGAFLDNSYDRTPLTPEAGIVAKNITITGVNSFNGNYTFGLKFLSNGVVTLTRISANGNDWDALNGDVGGGVSGIAKSITLTCGHMFGNGAGIGVHDPAFGFNLQVGLPSAGTAVAVPGVLTIKGIYSGGNNGADVKTLLAGSTSVITQACALP